MILSNMPDLQPLNPIEPPAAHTPVGPQTASTPAATPTSAAIPNPAAPADQPAVPQTQGTQSLYPTPTRDTFAQAAPSPVPAPSFSTAYGPPGSSRHAQLSVLLGFLPTIAVIIFILFGWPGSSRFVLYTILGLATLSAAAGLYLGSVATKKDYRVSPLSVTGIAASTVTIMLCLIMASYYIRLEMTLNKLKNQFDSSYQLYE